MTTSHVAPATPLDARQLQQVLNTYIALAKQQGRRAAVAHVRSQLREYLHRYDDFKGPGYWETVAACDLFLAR